MKELILSGMVAVVMAFGYWIMIRVDRFLDQNAERLEEDHSDEDAKK